MPSRSDAPRDGGRATRVLYRTALLSVCGAALVLGSHRARALGPPTIAVDTNAGVSGVQPETTFPAGTTGVAIVIAVSDAQPTGAFEFQLAFDPRVLHFQSWSEGPFLGSTGRETACLQTVTQTTISIACGTSGPAPPDGADGSGALATVIFDTLADGHTCLKLLAAETATVDGTPIVTATADGCITLSAPDEDGDGVPDGVDNCVHVANPDQANSDSTPLDNGPAFGHNDGTVPAGDSLGDACDADNDNDGLADGLEAPLAACGQFNGLPPDHPAPAIGDRTTDDNGDGNPAPPVGTDPLDQGASWDTDRDGALDGYECAHGSNPRDFASRPPSLPDDLADDDGDGLANRWERAGWGTDPGKVDSDGDGLGDCQEAADIDGNGLANFPGDTTALAKASVTNFPRTSDFDFNRDGAVNFPGDVLNHARRTLGLVPCL